MKRSEHSAPFVLGRYELVAKIASGGMATVYRGRKSGRGGFEREFAVKVVHPHLSAVDGFNERFLDEARVASRVHHPNVCAVIDIDADRGYQFLVLELIDGVTLRQAQVWGDGEPLEPEEAARIVADTAHGLEALHGVTDEHGDPLDVVHRDVSPHNLMIDGGGRTVLIDLGLAEARDKLGHTQTGVLCGKLPYMSPEQSLLAPLDHRSDLFSLGTVLFELVTGELPFGEDHTPDTLDRLRRCDAQSLAVRLEAHGIPGWLRDIIGRCLQLDPADRFHRAHELADALEAEMHLRGFQQSDIRARIAVRVRDTQAAIGGEEPVSPLPEPIDLGPSRPRAAAASGSTHDETTQTRAAEPRTDGGHALRPAVWGAFAFVAVIGIAMLAGPRLVRGISGESRPGNSRAGDASLGALERTEAAPPGGAAASHPEASSRTPARGRAKAPTTGETRTGEGPETTDGSAQVTPAPLDVIDIGKPPPRPRRRRAKPSDAGRGHDKLKRNPYTD